MKQGVPWPRCVEAGDTLEVIPEWNKTERWNHQFPSRVVVAAVADARCQSGVLFSVPTNNNVLRWLDAGWFKKEVFSD